MIGIGLDIMKQSRQSGPPAPPAIARVFKGKVINWDDMSGSGTLTLASVTLTAGSTLVVVGAASSGGQQLAAGDVKWGATNLIKAVGVGSINTSEIWYLEDVPGDTRDVTFDALTNAFALAAGMVVLELTGAAAASFDESATNSGGVEDPSVGPSGATDQNNEIVICGINFTGATPSSDTGSYAEGFTEGEAVGTDEAHSNFVLEESYKLITSAGTQTASKADTPVMGWDYALATFRSS